jgi:hypothetical protein
MDYCANKRASINERGVLWDAIQRKGEFYVSDLALETGLNNDTVRDYIWALANAGYIRLSRLRMWRGQPRVRWRIARQSPTPPNVRRPDPLPTLRSVERMWRSITILRVFTREEIIACSSDDKFQVTPSEAKIYLSYLMSAGYVRKQDVQHSLVSMFRLIRWAGPLPLLITKKGEVYDQNIKRVVWPRIADQENKGDEQLPDSKGAEKSDR